MIKCKCHRNTTQVTHVTFFQEYARSLFLRTYGVVSTAWFIIQLLNYDEQEFSKCYGSSDDMALSAEEKGRRCSYVQVESFPLSFFSLL